MMDLKIEQCFQPKTWTPIPERMEKVRNLICKRGEGPADYAWKAYQHAKHFNETRTAEFWWRCFVAWDG